MGQNTLIKRKECMVNNEKYERNILNRHHLLAKDHCYCSFDLGQGKTLTDAVPVNTKRESSVIYNCVLRLTRPNSSSYIFILPVTARGTSCSLTSGPCLAYLTLRDKLNRAPITRSVKLFY